MKVILGGLLVLCIASGTLQAQANRGATSMLRPTPAFPAFQHSLPTPEAYSRLDPAYRPNHWKTGALIGAAAGLALSTIVVASCDGSRDSSECPSWNRVPLVTLIFAGVGAAIGLFIPSGPPKAAEAIAVP